MKFGASKRAVGVACTQVCIPIGVNARPMHPTHRATNVTARIDTVLTQRSGQRQRQRDGVVLSKGVGQIGTRPSAQLTDWPRYRDTEQIESAGAEQQGRMLAEAASQAVGWAGLGLGLGRAGAWDFLCQARGSYACSSTKLASRVCLSTKIRRRACASPKLRRRRVRACLS